jgi:hypothetical protein
MHLATCISTVRMLPAGDQLRQPISFSNRVQASLFGRVKQKALETLSTGIFYIK